MQEVGERKEDRHRERLGAIMSVCKTQSRNQSRAVPSIAFRLLLNKNLLDAVNHAVYRGSAVRCFVCCHLFFTLKLYYNTILQLQREFWLCLMLKFSDYCGDWVICRNNYHDIDKDTAHYSMTNVCKNHI